VVCTAVIPNSISKDFNKNEKPLPKRRGFIYVVRIRNEKIEKKRSKENGLDGILLKKE
jgi:predicted transcriptional regulator